MTYFVTARKKKMKKVACGSSVRRDITYGFGKKHPNLNRLFAEKRKLIGKPRKIRARLQ